MNEALFLERITDLSTQLGRYTAVVEQNTNELVLLRETVKGITGTVTEIQLWKQQVIGEQIGEQRSEARIREKIMTTDSVPLQGRFIPAGSGDGFWSQLLRDPKTVRTLIVVGGLVLITWGFVLGREYLFQTIQRAPIGVQQK